MIYLFAGDDTKKKLESYEVFLKTIPTSIEILMISKQDFNTMHVESLYSGEGLFFSKSMVVFNNVFEREEARDFIIEKLPLISESTNDFVFIEGKLNKAVLDAFKKSRAELNIFEQKIHAEKFNNFLLANAFGVRDKKNLWIYFRQAMDVGVGMEELAGVLFWKIKDMLLKRNFSKFTEEELKNIAGKLSYLLPEARRDGRDAEVAFERFLLEAI